MKKFIIDYNTIQSTDAFDKKEEEIIQYLSQELIDMGTDMTEYSTFEDVLHEKFTNSVEIIDAEVLTIDDLPDEMTLTAAKEAVVKSEKACKFQKEHGIFPWGLVRTAIKNALRTGVKKKYVQLTDEKIDDIFSFVLYDMNSDMFNFSENVIATCDLMEKLTK